MDNTDLPILLLENKVDLIENPLETEDHLQEFAKKNNFIGAFRTSAKTGYNISESMEFLLIHIINKLEQAKHVVNENIREKSIVIEKTNQVNKGRDKSCC